MEEAICDVCLDCYGYDDDELILCELCNRFVIFLLSAIHQSCYGSDLDIIPEGNWFCSRCTYLMENELVDPKSIKCLFCPELKGIMKNIGDNIWAHVVCVNWIPEIYFVNDR